MEQKYDSFIDLTPGYESVVDISVESRDQDFWSRYIVNQDIVSAVEYLGKALNPNNVPMDVWHFLVQGSYGTGKTYIALVIKHLLEDAYPIVEQFLKKNPLFADVRDKFLGVRKKGKYYVKFRSGECRQLVKSEFLLFELEKTIRDILQENGFAYTGTNSLIDRVRAKAKEFRPILEQDFDNGLYSEYWGEYSEFDDFYHEVEAGKVAAINAVHEIFAEKTIGLATDLETFKGWMKDIYEGNPELAKTGIFIIWDEFTDYIRYNDLDIIQQLSLFSK